MLKVDDPLDAAAVHGFTGMWGLLAAALFADKVPTAAAYGDEIAAEGYGTPPRFVSLARYTFRCKY